LEERHERFSAGVGTVEPTHGDLALSELRRLAKKGFKGVSWHHRWQGSAIDDPTTVECLKALDELDLVGFVHCYQIAQSESFERLDSVLEYTDQPLVILDGLTSAMSIDRSIDLAREHDNLYFDTAMLYKLGLQIERLVEEVGAHRIVFGSDLYTEPLMYRKSPDLFQIQNAEITERERDKILSGNISELLSC
jgi:predicted TIM-barrel fold metal-dependent hydrolase